MKSARIVVMPNPKNEADRLLREEMRRYNLSLKNIGNGRKGKCRLVK